MSESDLADAALKIESGAKAELPRLTQYIIHTDAQDRSNSETGEMCPHEELLPAPGGGMADAEDLKSSGDFSSCGFDSHPGHGIFLLVSYR